MSDEELDIFKLANRFQCHSHGYMCQDCPQPDDVFETVRLIQAYVDQALTAYKKELLSKAIPVWRMNVYGKSKVTDEVIPVSAIQEDEVKDA